MVPERSFVNRSLKIGKRSDAISVAAISHVACARVAINGLRIDIGMIETRVGEFLFHKFVKIVITSGDEFAGIDDLGQIHDRTGAII